MNPKVSFVVPCYKLAHLLPECVNSILAQTYEDFEILIMDDCSPDNTPEVAQSFKDPRVRHIRNEPNLGHLRNYNKGIELSKGEYIWLISADDKLRKPYALQRYVELADAHLDVGFVCSPGVEIENGQETKLGKYSVQANEDTVFRGHEFLNRLLNYNSILAAAGMVRRKCYEERGTFPLDLPFAGDWYLWCLFALHYDVGYLAEPLVNYRGHELSMTNAILKTNVEICAQDDLGVLWGIKNRAERAGFPVAMCREAIALLYGRLLVGTTYRNSPYCMSLEGLESSLAARTSDQKEANWVQTRAFIAAGDKSYQKGEFSNAALWYRRAVRRDGRLVKVWAKLLLLSSGSIGISLRKGLAGFRRSIVAEVIS